MRGRVEPPASKRQSGEDICSTCVYDCGAETSVCILYDDDGTLVAITLSR